MPPGNARTRQRHLLSLITPFPGELPCYDFGVHNDTAGGPYVTAAFFCERALREADGVPSFIRAIDKWIVNGSAESMTTNLLQMTVVVMMKSGAYRGSAHITLTPTTPSGNKMPTITIPVEFEGDDDKNLLAMGPIGFPVSEPGPYWFDVAVDGHVLTRTAIRVSYLRSAPVADPQES